MVDYIYFIAYNINIKNLIDNKKFDFQFTGKVSNGIKTKFEGNWKGITISIDIINSKVSFRGSLHKYYHGNNYCSFTYNDFLECLNNLKEDFGINSKKTSIHRMEFGTNINLPFYPKLFTSRVIAHGRKRFKQMNEGELGTLGIDCNKEKYKIKIYDKSKQYQLSTDILRFEIVTKKMIQMHSTWKISIYKLSDLIDIKIWISLGNTIHKIFSNLIVDEVFDFHVLTQKEQCCHLKFRTSDIFGRTKTDLIKKHRNTLHNQMKKFKQIQDKYGVGLRECICERMAESLNALIYENCANAPIKDLLSFHKLSNISDSKSLNEFLKSRHRQNVQMHN